MVADIANGAKDGQKKDTPGASDSGARVKHSSTSFLSTIRLLQSSIVINQIHDAVIATDLEGNIVSWNKGAEKQLGYAEKEVIGKPIYILYPEERQKYLSEDIVKIFGEKGSFELELLMRRKSGELFYAYSSLSPLRDESENIIGIISYSLDITERKHAETQLARYRERLEELVNERTAELKLARQNLQKSNLSLKLLSRGNHALVHANDEKQLLNQICKLIVEVGNYKLAWVGYAINNEKKSIYPIAQCGFDEGYIDSLNLTWSDSDRDQGPAAMTIRAAEKTVVDDILKDPVFKPWRAEAKQRGYASVAGFPLKKKDDSTFGVLMVYSSLAYSFKDEEIEILTELADNLAYGITALRTTRELLQKEQLAALGHLISTVGHELRNPLGTIQTSLFNISHDLKKQDRERLEKHFSRAERNINRCDNIIEELLDYTRLSELSLETVAFDNWCSEVINEYEFPGNIKVNADFDSGVEVKIEQEKMRRCVINILNNACQSMEQNNEAENSLELDISTGHSDDEAWIKITDSGPGIPDESINRVLEPLYSTKSFGVGLGLPIVKQIMEKHKGRLSIDSQAGKGTTVKLLLPV